MKATHQLPYRILLYLFASWTWEAYEPRLAFSKIISRNKIPASLILFYPSLQSSILRTKISGGALFPRMYWSWARTPFHKKQLTRGEFHPHLLILWVQQLIFRSNSINRFVPDHHLKPLLHFPHCNTTKTDRWKYKFLFES